MDRSAIKTLVQGMGYGTDTQSAAAQDVALSAALVELSSERDWSWLRKTATGSLTIGNEVVPLPTDLSIPVDVRLALGTTAFYEPLQKHDTDEMNRLLHMFTGTDIPSLWSWRAGQIVVWPRPISAYTYTLDYIKDLDSTAFDTDGESPAFSDRFHVGLAWGTVRFLAVRQRDDSTYARASTEWEAFKRRAARDDDTSTPSRVKKWSGWAAVGG